MVFTEGNREPVGTFSGGYGIFQGNRARCSEPSSASLGVWERSLGEKVGLDGSWAGFWPPAKHFSLLESYLQEAQGNAAVRVGCSSGKEIGTSG